MRVFIALVFLAAVFVCLFTSKIAVAGFEIMSMGTMGDPQNLAVKFRETLYGQAIGTALASLALLLMMVNAFMQRAPIKGIVIGLFTLIAGAIAVLAVLDVGLIGNAAPAMEGSVPAHPLRPTLFGRMSLRDLSAGSFGFNLAMAHMRALNCLCLLSLGVSLTLPGGRAKPPAIPTAS